MRSDLRIADLRRREGSRSKLMNVKIPTALSEAIDRMVQELGAVKTDVVIALLNEGLDRSSEILRGWRPKPVVVAPPKRVCTRKGCGRPYVAKGLCASHYQAARRDRGRTPAG
ncbi:hypothetical protein KF840_17395 [bacterium]|nr:hypothetical protein [bacterium]